MASYPTTGEDLKRTSELLMKIKEYRANTGSDLTDEEISRWIEGWEWVNRFMNNYERKYNGKHLDAGRD